MVLVAVVVLMVVPVVVVVHRLNKQCEGRA